MRWPAPRSFSLPLSSSNIFPGSNPYGLEGPSDYFGKPGPEEGNKPPPANSRYIPTADNPRGFADPLAAIQASLSLQRAQPKQPREATRAKNLAESWTGKFPGTCIVHDWPHANSSWLRVLIVHGVHSVSRIARLLTAESRPPKHDLGAQPPPTSFMMPAPTLSER